MEAKVSHLEDQTNQLKEMVTRLKTKIGQQDSILTNLLQNKRQTNEETFSRKSVLENQSNNGKSAAIPRTCREVRISNPALASGMYWIDPDGQGVGDDPISVYCDMTSGKIFLYLTIVTITLDFLKFVILLGFKGSTSILHDSESPMNVGHCTNPGCYSRAINYNASTRQMAALTELSNECHQSVKVILCILISIS